MDDKERYKQEKKGAKARIKLEKKRHESGEKSSPGAVPPLTQPPPTLAASGSDTPAPARAHLTPAERSARAAEAHVQLTRRRVWIAAIALLAAIITAILAWLNYTRSPARSAPASNGVATHPPPSDATASPKHARGQ